ncbi:transposase [Streptomyces sp. NPDC093589]|uniref:IS110 family transposase n=1 Tax=Streptomyces sp. NPDC093589 TaxID=3366043 RepID=UPI0037FAF783
MPGPWPASEGWISPARKKSDRSDAALLANIVRTDGAWQRPMPRLSQEAMAVTVLARAQRKAVHTRQYHRDQLRSLLREFYPAALEAWQDLPSRSEPCWHSHPRRAKRVC